MEANSKRSSCLEVCHQRGVSVSHQSASSSTSSKSGKALKEKLRMAELLTDIRFPGERQMTEFKEHKSKVEEQYAKPRARVKVLEDLEGDNFNPAISHNSKTDIA